MNRKMTTGFYVPTPSFKSIPEHIAVMYEDTQNLVAICGPADDDPANLAETMRQARLFASAEEILDALVTLKNAFIHIEGNTKGNKAKTDIITLNPDVQNALNKVNNLLIYKLEGIL